MSEDGVRLEADALVLFGATGDLARKKLAPALYNLAHQGHLPGLVIGVTRADMDDQGFQAMVELSVRTHAATNSEASSEISEEAINSLKGRMLHISGDYQSNETYDQLRKALEDVANPLFYLAIPPNLFPEVIEGLARAGLAENARVMVEKPFGRDLLSAEELNHTLYQAFKEEAIYRIDHYLAKTAVEQLLHLRFANTLFEPVWNRVYIDHIQVTMAESFGVEGRGAFYDQVGAIRDVVQNHLLQVVSLLAMEAPVSRTPDALQDEKTKVLRSIHQVSPADVVRGQYHGYAEEHGVHPHSRVETYAALRLEIDSWRWAGVPFFVRAGKRLPTSTTEAVVTFKHPPTPYFSGPGTPKNHLRFRLGPTGGINLNLLVKDELFDELSQPVSLTADPGKTQSDPYTTLISDALSGKRDRFARADATMAAWSLLDNVLDARDTQIYEPGSWGPPQADALLTHHDGWHDPRTD